MCYCRLFGLIVEICLHRKIAFIRLLH